MLKPKDTSKAVSQVTSMESMLFVMMMAMIMMMAVMMMMMAMMMVVLQLGDGQTRIFLNEFHFIKINIKANDSNHVFIFKWDIFVLAVEDIIIIPNHSMPICMNEVVLAMN